MFQLNAFQRNAFEIGYTRPAGGFLHEALRVGKKRLDREARERLEAEAAIEAANSVPVVIVDDKKEAHSPAKEEQANRPDEYDYRQLVEEILLLEFHITDSLERKRLSNNLALCLLLLSE